MVTGKGKPLGSSLALSGTNAGAFSTIEAVPHTSTGHSLTSFIHSLTSFTNRCECPHRKIGTFITKSSIIRYHTRITLAVGGFNLSPISKELGKEVTEMLYLNVLDPNGSIPKVVVKRTVPERCLSVARARKCCAELAK